MAAAGGYEVAPGEDLEAAVAQYREDYGEEIMTGDPQVIEFALQGAIDRSELGALEGLIVEQNQVATAGLAFEDAGYDEELEGSFAAAAAPKSWTPAEGQVRTFQQNSKRYIINYMIWRSQSAIVDLESDAYEHDFKFFNPKNFAPSLGPISLGAPFCLWWQKNAFYAKSKGRTWTSNLPVLADVDLDTDLSDNCKYRDFTLQILDPTKLVPNVLYSYTVIARPGDVDRQAYQLTAQKLPVYLPNKFGVGLFGSSSDTLIPKVVADAPECRNWTRVSNGWVNCATTPVPEA
jgi:hypothetical protein